MQQVLELPARLQETRAYLLPSLLVEVHREEPAGLVPKQWIDADGVCRPDDLPLPDRSAARVCVSLCSVFLRSSGLLALYAFQSRCKTGRVAVSSIRALPGDGVNILPAANSRTKERNLLLGCRELAVEVQQRQFRPPEFLWRVKIDIVYRSCAAQPVDLLLAVAGTPQQTLRGGRCGA